MTPTETLVAELLTNTVCPQLCNQAADTLTTQSARIETLERMDREAATHVETVICMRTGFTGDPPYVGWKGLGLALTEHLDQQSALIETLRGELSALSERATGFLARAESAETALADARQQYVDANEAKIDAEVALADLRDMTLEEAAARIEPKNERSDWTQYAHFMHEAAESIRALKSA